MLKQGEHLAFEADANCLQWSSDGNENDAVVKLRFYLPNDYPLTALEQFDIVLSGCAPKSKYDEIRTKVKELIHAAPKEFVLYQIIETARDIANARIHIVRDDCVVKNKAKGTFDGADADAEEATDSREEDSKTASSTALDITIVSGEAFIERKSTFQAHFARVGSMDEVVAFREKLLLDRKIARATHNIFAYRFVDESSGIVHHDCDDDGENAAGGRLAETIRLMNVEGAAVVVTRWYGGILLGPDRFKYINNAARKLLETEFLYKQVSEQQPRHHTKKSSRNHHKT
jgi:hypothetical protein